MALGEGLVRGPDGVLEWRGGRFYKDPGEAVKTWWAGVLRCGCTERIFENYASHPCGKVPKYDPDAKGNPTKCGTHRQAAKDRRKAESEARRVKWQEGWEAKGRLREAERDVERALRRIADGHNDPRGLAQEVLSALQLARERAAK